MTWRNDDRAGGRDGGQELFRLAGQMMFFPVTLFTWSLDTMLRMARPSPPGFERSGGAVPRQPLSAPVARSDAATAPAADSWRPAESQNPTTPGGAQVSATEPAPVPSREVNTMDTNLSDDMVKLVRYTIVSIERDHERIIHHNEEIVTDNLTDDAFASWMIASYLQSKEYMRKVDEDPRHKIRHDHKKNLRVCFEVLCRWPKQDRKYEKRQLEVLEGIREAILRRPLDTDDSEYGEAR